MTTERIWNEFKEKMTHDTLNEIDFTDDVKSFLLPFLTGESSKVRREKFCYSPARFKEGENKNIVFLTCYDDDYRFDFVQNKDKWKLCFIEGITIPIENIENTPYTLFPPMKEDKEIWIRYEKNISKLLYFYGLIKKYAGPEKAAESFLDGNGEFLAAKSWVPFFDEKKAFIVYCAWIENRINGENIILEQFSNEKCIFRFVDHLWFKMYRVTGHFKYMIEFDEYKLLFEYIWSDRAKCSGWNICIEYDNNDTVLIFT